jgi:K+-sensing histidine kinase KdpD
MRPGTWNAAAPWLLGFFGVAATTAAGRAMTLNPITIGFAFLVVVLIVALRGGLLASAATSIAATLCFNFFYLPPLYTFTIQKADDWVALATFLATSVVVSRLVLAARIQAERADQRRNELETLYGLRESEMLKTSLLRAISHDLSTPLTAITIHTEAVRRHAANDEELQAAVAGISGETGRLRRRIDNLLSMARLEAGKAKPRREPTPPADLFHAAREHLPLVVEHRPVTVRVDDDCPDAYVDPSLALEILVNLIENAHRVSPPGAPLELVAGLHPENRAQVRLEVRDRGPGMPAGVADAEGRLLPGATSDVAQRGLGLEIARSLAVANGGSIGIMPRPGGGTVVRVDVPAASEPPP